MVDAFADPAFCLALARAVERNERIAFGGDGELQFTPTRAFADLARGGIEPVQHLGREQSNTSVILGERLFLKGYRRCRPGVNPDMEVPRYLTQAGFGFIAPLAGAIELVRDNAPPTTLASLFAFVRNQGDGWTYALHHLERFAATLLSEQLQEAAPHSLFVTQMKTLGRRVGEMHAVLAAATEDAAFAPEPTTSDDLAGWRITVLDEAAVTFAMVEQHLPQLPESLQAKGRSVLDARGRIETCVRDLARGPVDALRTRYHGDLHLGQVLLVEGDFLITDFEGEPARPIDERRRKSSPLRDVAGMLRSFDYARAVASQHAVALRPDLQDRVAPAFELWHQETCAAFQDGYIAGVGQARCVPTDSDVLRDLTRLFQIEKALYELRYELQNRPQWLPVPIDGLLSLIDL